MCAIFGYLGLEDDGLLQRMGDALVHRGPDGEGFFRCPEVALGNRRLSIIDIEGGDQPVRSEDGQFVVVFNGEIYNHVELAEELKERGHVFASRCDTEVIVHAYEEWGRDCLERFNGMFAFALWDAREERVLLARDRSGQKPLYYWQKGKQLVFASEVKALFQCGEVPKAVNRKAIDAYLTLRYVPEPVTMFEGIETLPAGCALTWSRKDGQVDVWRYWDAMTASDEEPPCSQEDSVDALEALLEDSVRLCMRSDVPVGSYLSGGVDSSLLVALMRRQGHAVKTFSVGFGLPGDEAEEAAETARLLGTEHHAVTMGAEDFGRLPEVVGAMDRPVGDPLIVAFDRMAEAASGEVKVVMSGEGADECFAGYSFHKLLRLMSPYSRWMPQGLHRGIAAPMFRAIPDGMLDKIFPYPAQLKGDGRRALDDFFTRFRDRDVASNCFALRTLWGEEERKALYADDALADTSWVPGLPEGAEVGEIEKLLRFQWREWLQDWALIRQDKNAMAHSLEVRLPFLDQRLIEFAFRSPTNWKIRGMRDKAILRDVAAKVLPAEVARRAKKPFFFPAEHFTQSDAFEQLIGDTLSEETLRARGYFQPKVVAELLKRSHAGDFLAVKKIFSLVILELWHRENLGV